MQIHPTRASVDVAIAGMLGVAAAVATREAAIFVGQGAEWGTIEAGKLADVIVVKGNVLENLNNLQHVTHVIKGGRVYK